MTTIQAIKYVIDSGRAVVSECGEFELHRRNKYLRCVVTGQQGGRVLSAIPLDLVWERMP
jgi:hypothetical protein